MTKHPTRDYIKNNMNASWLTKCSKYKTLDQKYRRIYFQLQKKLSSVQKLRNQSNLGYKMILQTLKSFKENWIVGLTSYHRLESSHSSASRFYHQTKNTNLFRWILCSYTANFLIFWFFIMQPYRIHCKHLKKLCERWQK